MSILSWVMRIFGGEQGESAGLPAPVGALVDMASYRKDERTARCGGVDPIDIFVAYAQDNHVYSADGRVVRADDAAYAQAEENDRLNKFGKVYRDDAKLWLHRALADIVVDAAIDLQQHQGWRLRIYDGLRTMEAGEGMYNNAKPEWLEMGLLARPGHSAHNRALAVDSKLVDAEGREIDEGGHFDDLRMDMNSRNYTGPGINDEASRNRLTREAAFQRAAMQHGTLIAPLRSEFWDDRMPGSEKDYWRVMESVTRIIGATAPEHKAESYAQFCAQFLALDAEKLKAALGSAVPPREENFLFHERYRSIYDRDLPAHMRQCDQPSKLRTASATRAVSLGIA